MKLNENAKSELDFWMKTIPFRNDVVMKNKIKEFFLPFASNRLTSEEKKYFTTRFFRELNKRQEELPIVKLKKDPRVVNYSTYEYDYDYWVEWMILKVQNPKEAVTLLSQYDPERDWADAIEITPSEYDCSGQVFSNGMEFTKLGENLLFAKKTYQLDI